ncbi:uncharacterized protein LOC144713314 [Wolffia australiana]
MEDNFVLRALEILRKACTDLQHLAGGGKEKIKEEQRARCRSADREDRFRSNWKNVEEERATVSDREVFLRLEQKNEEDEPGGLVSDREDLRRSERTNAEDARGGLLSDREDFWRLEQKNAEDELVGLLSDGKFLWRSEQKNEADELGGLLSDRGDLRRPEQKNADDGRGRLLPDREDLGRSEQKNDADERGETTDQEDQRLRSPTENEEKQRGSGGSSDREDPNLRSTKNKNNNKSKKIKNRRKSEDLKESPSLKALLALETESESGGIFSADPALSSLRALLSRLRRLSTARSNGQEIRHVARSIQSEIQSWIDREVLRLLLASLRSIDTSSTDALIFLLDALHSRLDRGFDRAFQDLLLDSAVFPAAAAALACAAAPPPVRDGCAAVVAAAVAFNRDVFVGHVIMGCPPVHRSLAGSGRPAAVRALGSLVGAIKSALVDELQADGQIPRLVALLDDVDDAGMTEAALDVILRMTYYARKEAVEAMVGAGVVGKLVGLQLSDLGGVSEEEVGPRRRPFAGCVRRLAVQVEIGAGMRRREKAAVKGLILACVREADAGEAHIATILAEVLWGSFP